MVYCFISWCFLQEKTDINFICFTKREKILCKLTCLIRRYESVLWRGRSLPNAILTPHIAWTTKEALQRLMDITTRNLRTWLEGSGEHIVNG